MTAHERSFIQDAGALAAFEHALIRPLEARAGAGAFDQAGIRAEPDLIESRGIPKSVCF